MLSKDLNTSGWPTAPQYLSTVALRYTVTIYPHPASPIPRPTIKAPYVPVPKEGRHVAKLLLQTGLY